jgi:hypothetical protein
MADAIAVNVGDLVLRRTKLHHSSDTNPHARARCDTGPKSGERDLGPIQSPRLRGF